MYTYDDYVHAYNFALKFRWLLRNLQTILGVYFFAAPCCVFCANCKVRLDANRGAMTMTASTFTHHRLLPLHHSPHTSASCRPASTPATRLHDVTMTSYPGISSSSAGAVGVYESMQSRAPPAVSDWTTRPLPVGHHVAADRRHLQQLELDHKSCDMPPSQSDSVATNGLY